MRTRQLAPVTLCIILSAVAAGCSRQDQQIDQHLKALQSLESTVHAIASAWLDGQVSGTYAHTALDQTFVLVEAERAALASRPQMMIDRRGARLSDTADDLERLIAGLLQAVRGADAVTVRDRVARMPIDYEPVRP
jgi:hypothetical protein